MLVKDKTLDLTGFNRANFAGYIRIRQIADWAFDYYKEGYKLARIKLHEEEYRELLKEIEQDNRYLRATPTETVSIDLGFGEIEIIDVDKEIKKRQDRCMWCGKPYAEHKSTAPYVVKVPCGLLKTGYRGA